MCVYDANIKILCLNSKGLWSITLWTSKSFAHKIPKMPLGSLQALPKSLGVFCLYKKKKIALKLFWLSSVDSLNMDGLWSFYAPSSIDDIIVFAPAVCLQKTLTLVITFEWQAKELSYFTCLFLVVRPFLWCQGHLWRSWSNIKVTFSKKKKKWQVWGH